MKTGSQDPTEHQLYIQNLRTSLRELAHEINNPLGVLRMTAYFLESGNPPAEKRQHYIKVMNESLDKIEASLHRLRTMLDDAPPAEDSPL